MESFVYVLMAGVGIFLLAGLISGIPQFQLQTSGPETVLRADIGLVGNRQKTVSKFDLGDITVGAERGREIIRQFDRKVIKNGIIARDSLEVEFETNRPEKADLSFKVKDTNKYSDLIVELNGKEVASSVYGENYEVEKELQKLKDGKNRLTIKAGGSPARIWAPTTYILQDLKLEVVDHSEHDFSEDFRLHDYEIKGFDRGEIVYFLKDTVREEPLRMDINNNQVYSARPYRRAAPYNASFNLKDSDLHIGENKIEVDTGPASSYRLENVELRIFYYAEAVQDKVVREFDLSKEVYGRLKRGDTQGKITFTAKRLLRGDFKLEIYNKTMDYQPKIGENTIYFDHSAVRQGENKISLITDGSYEINSFKIEVLKKE